MAYEKGGSSNSWKPTKGGKAILKKNARIYKQIKGKLLENNRIKDNSTSNKENLVPAEESQVIISAVDSDTCNITGRCKQKKKNALGKYTYQDFFGKVRTSDLKEPPQKEEKKEEKKEAANIANAAIKAGIYATLTGGLFKAASRNAPQIGSYSGAKCKVNKVDMSNMKNFPVNLTVISDGKTGWAAISSLKVASSSASSTQSFDTFSGNESGTDDSTDPFGDITIIVPDASKCTSGLYSSVDEIQKKLNSIYADAPGVVKARIEKHKETLRLADEYINTHYDFERIK